MARQRSIKDAYTGRSGQMAVLAELLMRECNVAVPEVDVGDDVLAFSSGQTEVTRLQVKTANAEPLQQPGHYSARVSISLNQLNALDVPKLYYIFAVRLKEQWSDFVIIPRWNLNEQSEQGNLGYKNLAAQELQLYLSFGPETLLCSGTSLQGYQNAWHQLPMFRPVSVLPTNPSLPETLPGAGGTPS
jgi:hypothetical protein